jgi:hypothetical protein
METNVATTEDSEAYETVNTEDDTDNEEMTLRPTTSKATAEAKYSDDNEEMTLRPTLPHTVPHDNLVELSQYFQAYYLLVHLVFYT